MEGINIRMKDDSIIYVPFIPKGLKFIESLKREKVDWKFYDSMFSSAKAAMKVRMAFFRMGNDEEISEESMEKYRRYITKNSRKIAKAFIEKNDEEMLTFMGENNLLEEKDMEYLTDISSKTESRCTGYLINYRQRKFGSVQKAKNRFRL